MTARIETDLDKTKATRDLVAKHDAEGAERAMHDARPPFIDHKKITGSTTACEFRRAVSVATFRTASVSILNPTVTLARFNADAA